VNAYHRQKKNSDLTVSWHCNNVKWIIF